VSRRNWTRAMALWLRRPIGVLYFLAGGLGCLAALLHQEPVPLLALILLGGALLMLALDWQTARREPAARPRPRPGILARRPVNSIRTYGVLSAAQVRKARQLERRRDNAEMVED